MGESAAVVGIEHLQRGRHCRVYRLVTGCERRPSVIAKWQDRAFGFERRVQEEVLPSVGLPSLEVYGELVEPPQDSFWIFFEDAGEEDVVGSDANSELVARWLAALHKWTGSTTGTEQLPDRGLGAYLAHLKGARRTIAASVDQPWLRQTSRAALRDVLSQLDDVEKRWQNVDALCTLAPRTLVHGDLAGKNARIRQRAAAKELVVFDWEMAGIGVPCVDLAQVTLGSLSPSLHCYQHEACGVWPSVSLDYLKRLGAMGKVFRLLAALDWEARSLPYEWCDGREFWSFPEWFRDAICAADI
jgi:hypothetical protein